MPQDVCRFAYVSLRLRGNYYVIASFVFQVIIVTVLLNWLTLRGEQGRPSPNGVTDEVQVVLLEPKGTLNTGNVTDERTVATPEWL